LAKSGSIVICLVDDDPSVLNATSRLLFSRGWQVEPFTDSDLFLRYAQNHHPPIAVIDFWMPHICGLEVAARLREISSSTRVIISLKVHSGQKTQQCMMARDELVSLIERQCNGTSTGNYCATNHRLEDYVAVN
jgi:FixJ family two-component response regulator